MPSPIPRRELRPLASSLPAVTALVLAVAPPSGWAAPAAAQTRSGGDGQGEGKGAGEDALAARRERAEKLSQAVALMRGPAEPSVRQGAHMCLELDDVPAMEALLDVLNGRQPHFRDIVWEVLPRFTDPYARERVAAELRENRRNERVRQWCAQLLGLYGEPAHGRVLRGALSDPHPFVVRAAAQALGRLRYEPATTPLLALVNSKDRYVRAAAVEALARIDPAKHEALFRRTQAGDGDGGVRCALLGVLPELWPAAAEAASAAALDDHDWRPRLQAVDNLGAIRTKSAIEALVRAATSDPRPVVARRAGEALEELTGQHVMEPKLWGAWWADHSETFRFPDPPPAAVGDAGDDAAKGQKKRPRAEAATVTYHGLPVVSDHVAFLIDTSATMRERSRTHGKPKNEVARAELQAILDRLGEDLTFNLFLYADEVQPLRKEPTKLTKAAKAAALHLVAKAEPRGNKNIWQALEAVVENPELDTLYLLSSGEPEVGLYVHWNRVCDHLAELNRFHKVTVHCVVYNESQWYRDQLQKIAETTGGEFRWFK